MDTENLCPLCGEGHVTKIIEEIESEYNGHKTMLPDHFKRCDSCGSEFAGTEECKLNWYAIMKKSEILKKALEEYDLNMRYHLGYVCHAVQIAVNGKDWGGARKPLGLRKLLNEIETSLCGEATITCWLLTYHKDWYMDNILTDKVTPFEYRKAWMQQMIKMYESKGE